MTSVFELARELGHERVMIVQEPAWGLRAVIAIHDTTLGRAIGDRGFDQRRIGHREGDFRRHGLRRRQSGDLRRSSS